MTTYRWVIGTPYPYSCTDGVQLAHGDNIRITYMTDKVLDDVLYNFVGWLRDSGEGFFGYN